MTFTHTIISKYTVSCGEPTTNPSVNLQLNSTLVGSRLLLWCGEGDNVTTYTSRCSENATWLPDPAQLVCPLSSLPPSNTISFPTLTGTVIHALCLQLWVNKGNIIIAGNCRGRKFSRISRKEAFYRENFRGMLN